ncbi:hypothetical protein Leryth_011078 [Lithospermum erythrorhizon]|nr:hypothetical protein Leryth_011078 [Lithospermum erythrorhizon]
MNSITPKLTTSLNTLHPISPFSLPNPSTTLIIKSSFSDNPHKTTLNPQNNLKPLEKFQSFPLKTTFSTNPSTPFNLVLKASSSDNSCQNPQKFQSLSIFKPTFVAAVATTALLFSSFNGIVKPAIAVTASPPPPTVETERGEIQGEEKERDIEEHLVSCPNDVDALRNLMEIKIKNQKFDEAMSVIDRLIEIEPNEVEWPLLKSHLYVYNGDIESAKMRFSEIINKDPLRVEAYHGLVMAASQDDNASELKGILERVEEGMKLAKKQNKKSDLRDFKLLIAQVRVIEGEYNEALKVYQELVKEEPRDFRPYLCQGIIYTLLRKNSEAEKSFEKYRRLVPKGHPYARYFDDNMIATKLFAQKVESERAGMKV